MRLQIPSGALVHTLRHTFAATALEGGVNVVEVSQLLGHASLTTTQSYVKATADELRDALYVHPAQQALTEFVASR